jgi:NAD(P)-dependent dehydrogenase (short-subunit alcohol dehydrogenase family)
LAVECDVTDPASVASAVGKAAADLGGIDALVYTPAIGPLARLVDTDVDTWRRLFDTNVTGAAVVTAAAIPHLTNSSGTALYLSSVSASLTPPWPGLGAYAVSKAALDKLVEAWRVEHPTIGFTRCTVGDCMGGEGDSMTGFAAEWDWDLAGELHPVWEARGLLAGCFIDGEDLVNAVDGVLRSGQSLSTPSITLAPRPAGS